MLGKKSDNLTAARAVRIFRSLWLITVCFGPFSLMSGVSQAADYLNDPQLINGRKPVMSGDTVYLSKDFTPASPAGLKSGITVESGFKGAQIINVSADVQSLESNGILISGDAAAVIKKSHANSAVTTSLGAGVGIFNNSSADISESTFQSAGIGKNSAVSAAGNSFVKITSSDVTTDGSQRGHAGVYIGDKSSAEVSGNKITVIENSPSVPGVSDQAFGYGVHVDKNSSLKLIGNNMELKITVGSGDEGSAGVRADNGSSVESSGNTFKSNGKSMKGFDIANGSKVSSEGDTFVADGPWSRAFQVSSNSSAVIRSADITANGGKGYLSGKNASGDVIVTVISDAPIGIYSGFSSSFDIADSTVKVKGANARALAVEYNSYGKADNVNINTEGNNAYAATVFSKSSLNISNSTITTNGENAHAITANGASSVDISGSTINTKGAGSYGIDLNNFEYTKNSAYANINNSQIYTEGLKAHGIRAIASSFDIKDSSVTTNNNESYGMALTSQSYGKIENTNIQINGTSSYGILSITSSDADVIGGKLTTTDSTAGYARGDSSISFDGTEISVGGRVYAFLMYDGTINLNNVNKFSNASGALLQAESSGTFNLNNSIVDGAIIHGAKYGKLGAVDVSMTNSAWSGFANVLSKDVSTAKINLTIDETSLWNVTNDSYTNGALNNNRLINFGEKAEDGFKTVEVASYRGGADSALVMKTDINSKEKNDKLLVSGNAEGTSKIAVYNKKASGVERSDALIVVKGDSTNAKFELGNADETIGGISYISAGAWKYRLENSEEKTAATTNNLNGTANAIAAAPSDPGTGTPAPAREWYLIRSGTTATGEAISQAAVQHDLWYTETNTMTKRLGIYRDDMWNGGFWIEAAANKEDFKIEKTNMLNENQNFKTGTLGYDWKRETEKGATWYGIMAGYGKSNSDLVGGVGDLDVKSFHASLYAVHRRTDGIYINGILKYNKYKNEMEITHKDSFTADLAGYDGGEWDQNGLGMSVQVGRKIDLDKGWYAEPQVQFSWNRVFASDYTTKSGITVDIDDIDYIRLRGGLVVGKQITYADGRFVDLYGDISVIHDFDGDATMRMSGAEHKSSLGGTWGTFGLGANYRYADGKFAHIRFQYSDGTSYREPFTVYAGLSFETK